MLEAWYKNIIQMSSAAYFGVWMVGQPNPLIRGRLNSGGKYSKYLSASCDNLSFLHLRPQESGHEFSRKK